MRRGMLLTLARFAPAGLAAVIGALTLAELAYLRSVDWSPIHRTPTEWPSLLALGPGGWILTTALVAAGALGAAVGVELWRAAPERGARSAAWLFIVMNVALGLVAFSADPPNAKQATWHSQVHNAAYPFLVVAATASMAFMAASRNTETPWARLRHRSRLALPLVVGGVIVGNIDAIAQTGRYVLIGGLIAWSHAVARAPAHWTGRFEPGREPARAEGSRSRADR